MCVRMYVRILEYENNYYQTTALMALTKVRKFRKLVYTGPSEQRGQLPST